MAWQRWATRSSSIDDSSLMIDDRRTEGPAQSAIGLGLWWCPRDWKYCRRKSRADGSCRRPPRARTPAIRSARTKGGSLRTRARSPSGATRRPLHFGKPGCASWRRDRFPEEAMSEGAHRSPDLASLTLRLSDPATARFSLPRPGRRVPTRETAPTPGDSAK